MTYPDHASIPATPAELLELVRMHADFIGMALMSRPWPAWPPTLAVLTRTGPAGPADLLMYVIEAPFNDPADKRAAVEGIGRTLYAAQIIPAAAVLSSEAWIAPDHGAGCAPADSPNRKEVIILAGATVGGEHAALQQMYVGRGPDDEILPGTWSPPQTEGVEPRLVNRLWAGYFEHVIKKFGRTR